MPVSVFTVLVVLVSYAFMTLSDIAVENIKHNHPVKNNNKAPRR